MKRTSLVSFGVTAIVICIILVALLRSFFQANEISASGESSIMPKVSRSSQREASSSNQSLNGEARDRLTKPKPTSGLEPAEKEIYPEIDAIVGNTNISNEEAADSLIRIAAHTSASLGERTEALSHAMLLANDEKFNAICALAKDAEFPVELADMVTTELYNRPLSSQIAGTMMLLDHLDTGVSSRAAELLAFVIEREDLQHQIPELKAAALQKSHEMTVDNAAKE